MHRREIHLNVVGTSRNIFGMERLCFMVGFEKSRGRPRGVKNWLKSVKIKVQSLGSASAGAGAILKRLRNSKMAGKGRIHSDGSLVEDSHGKCYNSSGVHVDEVLSKVLDRLTSDKSISDQIVFKEGVNDSDKTYSSSGKNSSSCLIDGNDGSC
ncbi:hypothetical protein Tco_1518691 [Tanacetum coccineum]